MIYLHMARGIALENLSENLGVVNGGGLSIMLRVSNRSARSFLSGYVQPSCLDHANIFPIFIFFMK
jgi:hypothetical protein